MNGKFRSRPHTSRYLDAQDLGWTRSRLGDFISTRSDTFIRVATGGSGGGRRSPSIVDGGTHSLQFWVLWCVLSSMYCKNKMLKLGRILIWLRSRLGRSTSGGRRSGSLLGCRRRSSTLSNGGSGSCLFVQDRFQTFASVKGCPLYWRFRQIYNLTIYVLFSASSFNRMMTTMVWCGSLKLRCFVIFGCLLSLSIPAVVT
jgi:hypothetical protein